MVREQVWRKAFRIEAWSEQKGSCRYCHEPMTIRTSTADHVVPRSRNGKTTKTNIVAACGHCNRTKGSISEARFLSLIKGNAPPHDIEFMKIWFRRKLFLRTEKAVRRIMEQCR